MADATIRVSGYREVSRAFKRLDDELKPLLKTELLKVGEPVRVTSEQMAADEISNLGPVWDRMRLGVTLGGVYVAPASRRKRGSPRPNLGPLLLTAMLDALDENEALVVAGLGDMLDGLAAEF